MPVDKSLALLNKWKLTIGLIISVVTPVSAYYSTMAAVSEHISKVELDAAKTYTPKDDFKELRSDVSKIRQDIGEIKGILKDTDSK